MFSGIVHIVIFTHYISTCAESGSTARRLARLGETELDHTTPPDHALMQSERGELRQELTDVRRKARRHGLWAVLGFSPAAIIPAIGLMSEGSLGILVALSAAVSLSESYLWHRNKREANRLEQSLDALVQDGSEPPGHPNG
jgi:hypothetical protein